MILTHSSHLADKMKFYGSQCKAPGKQFFMEILISLQMPNINAARLGTSKETQLLFGKKKHCFKIQNKLSRGGRPIYFR